ncbi:MAG: hypothetical protein ACLPX1_02700 [Steroidobacteraceae bacterium]
MGRLPTLIASSVIRGTELGESHGGLYLIDLDRGVVDLKLDWNRTGIDVGGRGGDRGLRGIAFHGQHVLVAANSELLVFDHDFSLVESFTNPYLRHCHEISVAGDLVFLTSTGVDSVLTFNLQRKRFVGGWHLDSAGDALSLRPFDPSSAAGPAESNRFHLNSVTASTAGIWLSGLNTPGLLYADSDGLSLVTQLPRGTHNAQLLGGGVLYNDTPADRVCYTRNGTMTAMAVPEFNPKEIIGADRYASELARPGFARGLCALRDGLIAAGSSPSTVSLYDLRDGRRILQQNLSMDVRNAVHGLAVWPYS